MYVNQVCPMLIVSLKNPRFFSVHEMDVSISSEKLYEHMASFGHINKA